MPKNVALRAIGNLFSNTNNKRIPFPVPQQDMNPLTQRVLRSYTNIREMTQELIDDDQLERIAQMIDQSERVYFSELEALA